MIMPKVHMTLLFVLHLLVISPMEGVHVLSSSVDALVVAKEESGLQRGNTHLLPLAILLCQIEVNKDCQSQQHQDP